MHIQLGIGGAAAALAVLFSAACDIRLPDGKLICHSDQDCPSGWSCADDQRCYSTLPDAAEASEGHVQDPVDGGNDAQDPTKDAGGMSHHEDGGLDASQPSTGDPARVDAACAGMPGVIVKACSEDGFDKLVCLDGRWKFNGTCDGDTRCARSRDDTLGTCQPITPLCSGKQPGDALCDHGQRKRCSADLTDYESADCAGHMHCEGEDARCVCDSGYRSTAAGSCEKDECPSGYERGADGCKDIDECALNHGACDPHRSCMNSAGSFSCGDCDPGFVPNGANGCIEPDPCESNNGGCGLHRSCVKVPTGRMCASCDVGYAASGETDCVDLDECATNNGGCDSHRKCVNSEGNFSCADCATGYMASGATGCVDIDECATSNGDCGAHRICTNTDGGHQCGSCASGYSENGAGTCLDVDECATNNGGCGLRPCTNTDGGVSCGSCPAGYTDDANGGCVDIDECKLKPCPARNLCTNTQGGFECEPISTCFASSSDSAIPQPIPCLQAR